MILITIKIITTELFVIFNIHVQEKMAITKINYKNNILFPYVMDKWEASD